MADRFDWKWWDLITGLFLLALAGFLPYKALIVGMSGLGGIGVGEWLIETRVRLDKRIAELEQEKDCA